MLLVMEVNIAFNPDHIGLFGAYSVMFKSNFPAYLIKQLG